ncbi:hypothetical protein WDW89_05650 [Deltaproteobacteria bacterium TL4]
MSSTLTPEAKKLILEIHEEYESLVPTLRNEFPYTEALLKIQMQVLDDGNPQILREAFEKLKRSAEREPSLFEDPPSLEEPSLFIDPE